MRNKILCKIGWDWDRLKQNQRQNGYKENNTAVIINGDAVRDEHRSALTLLLLLSYF